MFKLFVSNLLIFYRWVFEHFGDSNRKEYLKEKVSGLYFALC